MPTVVESEKSQSAWAPPATRPLDEAAWQAWVAKGHAQDRRSIAARIKAVKWTAIVALLAATGHWSDPRTGKLDATWKAIALDEYNVFARSREA